MSDEGKKTKTGHKRSESNPHVGPRSSGFHRLDSVESFKQGGAPQSFEQQLSAQLDQLATSLDDEAERQDWIAEMKGFEQLHARFLETKNSVIEWDKIRPPSSDTIVMHDSLPEPSAEDAGKLLKKLVVLKLNGGLGTTMGCVGPKSAIEVRRGLTFLDMAVRQLQHLNEKFNADVPLVLMNSFNTHQDTLKIVGKYAGQVDVLSFNQNRYPRISKASLMPIADEVLGDNDHWYPPGHGDIYGALQQSGLLDQLIEGGNEYLFVSNVDNLGATVDLSILNHMDKTGTEFVMEVTNKTRADVKGGTLIDYEGKTKLFEIAQCPAAHVNEFKSIKKFKIFNTNNLWVNLKALRKRLNEKAFDNMDIICNQKVLSDNPIIQLERACGAAIEFFDKCHGVNVGRERFLPVKSTSDLLLVQSNLYELEHGRLILSPKRQFGSIPLIKLGSSYKKVHEYKQRLGTIPDILELDHLTVSGDVYFGEDTVLKGTVIVVANHGSRIDLPSGSIIENRVVSGNLRIMEH